MAIPSKSVFATLVGCLRTLIGHGVHVSMLSTWAIEFFIWSRVSAETELAGIEFRKWGKSATPGVVLAPTQGNVRGLVVVGKGQRRQGVAISAPCHAGLSETPMGGVNAENLKHERGEIYASRSSNHNERANPPTYWRGRILNRARRIPVENKGSC